MASTFPPTIYLRCARMTTALAIYGALVGSAALAWQIWSQLRAERTMLEVRVGAGWDGKPEAANHRLYATVVNRSRHPVALPGVTIYQPAIGRAWPIRSGDTAQGLPETLMARGLVTLDVPIARFAGLDLESSVVATAITATGEHFASELSALCWVPGRPTRVPELDGE